MSKVTVKEGQLWSYLTADLPALVGIGRLEGLRLLGDPSGRRWIGFAAVVVMAVLVATAALIVELREQALDTAEANIVRVNFVLAESLERLIQTIDHALIDTADDVAKADSPSYAGGEALHARLRSRVDGLTMVPRMGVVDAAGRAVNSSAPSVITTMSLADRPYFVQQRDHSDLGLVVSDPVRGRTDNQWTIVLSRRITAADGAFLGLAVAAIDFRFLDKLFATVMPEPGARVALLRKDMVLIHRYPESPDFYGRSLASLPSYSGMFADGQTAGSGRFPCAIDRRDRVSAGRLLERYPLAVSVGVPVDTILEPWQRLALGIGLGALAVAVGFSALVVGLFRQARRRRAGEAALAAAHDALAEERGRLSSVVEAAHDGFWEWHLDSGMVDWSERCCAMMGLPAAGGVLHIEQVVAMVLAEDRESYWRTVRRNIESGESFEIEARWQTLDGSIRWLASRGRLVRNAGGRPVRVVGANADITECRRAEASLIEAGLIEDGLCQGA